MASEIGYLAVGHIERQVRARVSAFADLEGVASRLDRSFDRLVPFDRSDTLTVDHDVERAAAELHADPFSRELQRCGQFVPLFLSSALAFVDDVMTPTTSRPGDEGCGTVDGNGVEIGICEIEGFRSIQWPEEAGAERFHVELQADAPGEAAVLLCALAASRPDFPPGADRWRVLLDPDGRPLCLSPRGAATL